MSTTKPLTEEQRLHKMTWAIDPKGALRDAGMDVDAMAKRAMKTYEENVPGAADQTKRIEEMASRIYWGIRETYNAQSHLIEVMGSALWDLFGVQKDIDTILKMLEPKDDE